MLAAPTITDQIRSISKYLLDNLNIILLKIRRHQKMTANLSCQLAMTEYAQQHPHKHGHRSSKIDLRMDDGKSSMKDVAPNNHAHTPADVDAFEHILQVTSHQEAVYAYYYMDENNKVKVTEIFDMTDNENPNLQTANEREVNQQLEFDTDWETTQPDYLYPGDYYGSNMINIDEYIDPASLEEIFINNNNNNSSSIQWQYSEIQIDEIQSDASDTYLRPEADQQNTLMSDTTNLLLNKAPAYSIVEM